VEKFAILAAIVTAIVGFFLGRKKKKEPVRDPMRSWFIRLADFLEQVPVEFHF